jgi:gliding motility-associated-like protein
VGTLASGCTGSTTVSVILGNNPVVTVNPATSQLCDGSNINITAFGAVSYSWSPANTLNNSNTATVIANPTVNTTYTVTGTAANGCTASATSAISLVQPEQVTATSTANITCPGNVITLNAQNASQYAWSPAGGTGQNTATYQVTPLTSTTYTVTGTDANGCTSSATISIQVLTPPAVTASNNNALICQGNFTTLTAGGALNYVWSPSTYLSSSTGTSVLANPPLTATYTVNGVDANGCSANATVVVNVDPFPVAAFVIEPDKGCSPLTVSFTNNSNNAISYAWIFDNGQTSQSTNSTALYTSGTYYPMLIATNTAGCSDTAVYSSGITVYPPPIADFTSTPDTGVLMKYTDATVTFTNLSQGATSYLWNFGDGTTDINTNPIHRYLSKGSYTVTLTAISEHGCSSEISKGYYLVEGMPPVYVPNTFTPNGDGRNDVFRVYAIGLKEFELKVFDRWGNQVFSSNDIEIPWDGTFNGTKLNPGVYVYQLRAVLQNDDPLLKYGDITLLK